MELIKIQNQKGNEKMEKRPIYKIEYLAKTPNGISTEVVKTLTASDSDRIGKFLTDGLVEYGNIANVTVSYIPCPLCNKCPKCGI